MDGFFCKGSKGIYGYFWLKKGNKLFVNIKNSLYFIFCIDNNYSEIAHPPNLGVRAIQELHGTAFSCLFGY